MRTVRAVAALIAIASLIVGVPIALWVFGSPRALMSIHWSTLLTTPADSGIILALLSLVGWVAWAVLAATVVAEGITVLSRQRIRVRVPGTAWLRPVAAALVSAAFAIPTVAHAAPAPPAAPDAPAPISVAQGPSAPAAPEVSRTYLVQSGDELWDVAERELSSGEL